ncbi:MAG TPA: NAD(P)H-dependent oxidoreductase [Hydrogenophaga sp.]|nr:NAD(P)H-dependent oxidoreductase [Hydrogenophaga sp.]HSX93871.1 NAD(P)H-dependent oxidoreductase [Hydrogenophaga sp.]
MNVLVINASPRRERSLSRRLASEFLARWRALRMPAALKPGSTR